jgi:hypothetical protein
MPSTITPAPKTAAPERSAAEDLAQEISALRAQRAALSQEREEHLRAYEAARDELRRGTGGTDAAVRALTAEARAEGLAGEIHSLDEKIAADSAALEAARAHEAREEKLSRLGALARSAQASLSAVERAREKAIRALEEAQAAVEREYPLGMKARHEFIRLAEELVPGFGHSVNGREADVSRWNAQHFLAEMESRGVSLAGVTFRWGRVLPNGHRDWHRSPSGLDHAEKGARLPERGALGEKADELLGIIR